MLHHIHLVLVHTHLILKLLDLDVLVVAGRHLLAHSLLVVVHHLVHLGSSSIVLWHTFVHQNLIIKSLLEAHILLVLVLHHHVSLHILLPVLHLVLELTHLLVRLVHLAI